jgi:integrase
MTYYATFRLADGRRNRFKVGVHGAATPAQARDAAKKVLAKVTNNEDPTAARRAAKAHNLKSFIEHKYGPWVETHRKDGKATASRILTCFTDLHGKKLNQISPWLIDKWRSVRLKAGRSAATINRDIGALRSALSKAVEWHDLDSHPLAEFKPLKVDASKKTRYLTVDEEARLRATLDEREERARGKRDTANAWRKERGYTSRPDFRDVPFVDHLKPMVLLSINTGLRRGEVFHLKWENIDLSHSVLTVTGDTAKSGQTRQVPLNQEAAEVLRCWKGQSPVVDGLAFPGRNGKPFDTIKTAWAQLLRAADIQGFRWHDMRHHFASKLAMASVDLNTIRELLGHSDLKMTLRYAHLAPHVKAEAVEKLAHG